MEGHAEFNLEWQNDVKTLIIVSDYCFLTG